MILSRKIKDNWLYHNYSPLLGYITTTVLYSTNWAKVRYEFVQDKSNALIKFRKTMHKF